MRLTFMLIVIVCVVADGCYEIKTGQKTMQLNARISK